MPYTGAVLWDLDGTLVDSEQYHWLAWRDTMAAEGVALTHADFLKTFGLRNDAIVPQWIPGATPERDPPNRRSPRNSSIAVGPRRRSRASAGRAPLDRTVGPRRLASGHRLFRARAKTSTWCWLSSACAGCFQAIVSAEDVTLGKPDPQVFLTAASRLGSAPAHSIVVEDAPAGIEAARRAGMPSIGVRRNGSPLPADLAVSSLADLPADAFSRLIPRILNSEPDPTPTRP